VGTSIAAFIGVAAEGELDTPVKLTSFKAFTERFGARPVPGFYLWYAVRGYFENGGRVCYIVRASNGDYAPATLNDAANRPLVNVRARRPGNLAASPIDVTATRVNPSRSQGATLYQPTGNGATAAGPRAITMPHADAVKFRPGDWIFIDAANPRVQVISIQPGRNAPDTLRLDRDLAGAVNGAQVRLADAPAGQVTFRIDPGGQTLTDVIVPGAVLRVTQNAAGGNVDAAAVVQSVQSEPLALGPGNTLTTYRVTFREPLGVPVSMAAPAQVEAIEVNIDVSQAGTATPYLNLGADPAHPRYFLDVVNASTLVRLEPVEPAPSTRPPNNRPDGAAQLAGGADENLLTLSDQDYTVALDQLRSVDEVTLVSIPDAVTLKDAQADPDPQAVATVQQAMIGHCELLGDRFAVLDPRPGLPLFATGPADENAIDRQRAGLDSARGYAALYYPWLQVARAGPGGPILVPPSGHMCGVMARTDDARGVFKAPAGTEATVNGATDVETTMSDIEQGELNLLGINVIRVFGAGGRPVVWGARTTATDKNWQYVPIRRLFLYLEESIQDGIRTSVFDPNEQRLWARLRRTIRAFLRTEWRRGALYGADEDQAFYVTIDETNNPSSERRLGRLHIEIGIQPAYPAEFIVVRIGIWEGGSEVEEG
jgi:hypothetical protein